MPAERVFRLPDAADFELGASIGRLLGRSIEPEYAPPRLGDVRHSLADIARARKELGYEVGVGFDEGLAQTIEHYVAVGERLTRADA